MNFLPKVIEDIIIDYKEQLEREEHKEKFSKTLDIIKNLYIFSFKSKPTHPFIFLEYERIPLFLYTSSSFFNRKKNWLNRCVKCKKFWKDSYLNIQENNICKC